MSAQLDSNLTASFLESGRTLAGLGNAAAVIAGLGSIAGHSKFGRLLFACSMFCWLAGCWFTVRVRIDAALFRQLAAEPESGWQRLDALLTAWGFLRTPIERSVEDRTRGAIALWRKQAFTLAIHLASLIVALLWEALESHV